MELKKNPRLDYRKKYALFLNIGLVTSLLLVISAFEWKFVERVVIIKKPVSTFDNEPPTPITDITPPKPRVQVIKLIEIPDEIEIDDPIIKPVIVFEPDVEIDEGIDIFKEPIEVADEIVSIAETMPSFPGGDLEFYKFISKNLKYPAHARRIGIQGKVFAYFVVDKDGSLSDISIAKGIGAGCDEEVMRILSISPKWNPGKQRGRPVRVRMILPITFKLE